MTGKIVHNLLNSDPRTPFMRFAQQMYQRNIMEREFFGDEPITLEKYLEKNIKFLLDKFDDSVL